MSGSNPPDNLPRNYLQPCLLLLLNEHPSHGYGLIEGVGRLGIAGADPGGVYRALRSMEREGLVTSFWEQSTAGPARRSYDLTDAGREALAAWAEALRSASGFIGEFLARWEKESERAPGTH